MPVGARWGHQGGNALDQLQRRKLCSSTLAPRLSLVGSLYCLAQRYTSSLPALRPMLEQAGHALTVDLPGDRSLPLEVDRARMVQVLINLLTNAAKYTPLGGQIRLSAAVQGDQVAIAVTDNGVGMPRHMLPQVFDLFTQVKDTLEQAQGGLGLGLALVRQLVLMHGGTVEAHSPGVGLGSTFRVCLPLAANAAKPVPLASAPAEAPGSPEPAQGRRILVVDDNIDAAESLSTILEMAGHQLTMAHTGPDAVKAAARFHPDVVILDIGLPGMSGYDVAQALRGSGPTLIALTGWGAEHDRQRAKDAGFDFHLTKPVDIEMVEQLLASLPSDGSRSVTA